MSGTQNGLHETEACTVSKTKQNTLRVESPKKLGTLPMAWGGNLLFHTKLSREYKEARTFLLKVKLMKLGV